MRLRQRVRQSSHGFKLSLSTDASSTESEVNDYDGRILCSLCELAKAPCLTAAQRNEITSGEESITVGRLSAPIPSECTCNTVYFDLWSACAILEEDPLLLTYGEWVTTCQHSSLGFLDHYPHRWAKELSIERWTVEDHSASGSPLSIRDTASSTTIDIISIVAGVVGLTIFGALSICIYWLIKRRNSEGFVKFWHRRLQGPEKVRHASRTDHFEIDRTTEDGHRFTLTEDSYHSHLHSSGSVKTVTPEYRFPFRNIWRNSQIIQQFRRLPDRVPLPFMDRPVQIRPSDPGVRFRVDPSGSSVESSGASAPGSRATTVEGGRPDTIFEDDEYANNADNEPGYRNSYYGDEETALITPIERQENDVFLISNRPSFTLSSNSHHVTVVPPTPTESSASAGHALDVIPPTVVQPRLPLIIPPVPRTPPPVPPGAATKPNPLHGSSQSVHGPRERVPRKAVTKDTDIHPKLQTNLPTAPRHADPRQLGQPQDIPHFPPPPAAVHFKQTLPPQTRPQADISVPLVSHAPRKPSVDEAHSKIKTTMAPTKGRSDTLAPILPSSSTSTSSASRAPSPAPTPAPTPTPGHAPRQPSLDSLKNAHERPMGPRRPSSPRHIARQISLDEEMGKFRPTVPPGESAYASPPPNPVAAAPALAAVRGVGIQHAGHDHHVYPKRGYSVEDIVDAMSVSTSMSMSNGSLSPAVPSEESMFLGSHPFSQAERIVRAQHDVHHHRKATSDDVRMMTRVEQGARPSHSASPAPAPHPHPHQHIHRQYSNDNAPGLALGPVNAHPYTYAHRPTLSPPPQAMHDRNSSLESLMSILPGDGRMLYPGPVRAAGYNIHLPPDATE